MSDALPNAPGPRAVLPCKDLAANLAFFREELGFRLDGIAPADAPAVAILSRDGLRIELRKGNEEASGRLLLPAEEAAELIAPIGTLIELRPAEGQMVVPPIQQELVVTRLEGEESWGVGRAGMLYRDLIPGRLGGRYAASHIRIPKGGPVPDSVHHHQVRFQMIFCVKGWVRVAYQDQGEPMVLEAGDAFLQPPGMRHQVLESSDGLEVIEIASPAQHDTWFDHDLKLPNGPSEPDREYGGQRFVYHQGSAAPWTALGVESTAQARAGSLEVQDLGFAAATSGLARVRVLRSPTQEPTWQPWPIDGEFLFLYLLRGSLGLQPEGKEPIELTEGDCASLPPAPGWQLTTRAPGTEWLEISL